jgi:hypothetical protein
MPTIKYVKENPYSDYLTKLAKVESGNNPNAKAKTSSASGAYQFVESTWKGLNDKYKLGYTLNDRFDPVKSKKMAEILTQENEAVLKKVLGRDLNDGERYLGHFLGAEGSKNLLSIYSQNPNEKVGNVVSKGALEANKSIFFNKDGSQKTVADVYNWASKKMNIAVPKQDNVTTDVNNLEFTQAMPIFAGVPDSAEKEETDKDIEEVKQKTAEYNFLQEIQNAPQREALAQQEQQSQQRQQVQTPNYLEQYEQISQFVDSPLVAQQGGKYSQSELAFLSEIAVKDNNGYWNPKNKGKIVQIDGSKISMKNVNQDLLGIADTGEQKVMKPNQEYNFKGATKVLEIPLFKK